MRGHTEKVPAPETPTTPPSFFPFDFLCEMRRYRSSMVVVIISGSKKEVAGTFHRGNKQTSTCGDDVYIQ